MSKLYRIVEGKIEVVRIIREHLADGASISTYIVRYKDGREARVSKDLHDTSQAEAWQTYVDELTEAIRLEEKGVLEANERILRWSKKLLGKDDLIRQLRRGNL